jgi:uncharacterized protein
MTTPQVDAITLGTKDLSRARQFYSEGLGCPILEDNGEFVSLRLGDGSSALGLYRWDALAGDRRCPGGGERFPRLHAVGDRRLSRAG